MKNYIDYMNRISVDRELHDKIVRRAGQKSMPRRIRAAFGYAGMAMGMAILLLCVWLLPGLGNNKNKITRDNPTAFRGNIATASLQAALTVSPNATPMASPTVNPKAPYKIMTETYTQPLISSQDRTDVQYPQIQGLGNALKEKAVNDMLKNHIIESVKKDYQFDASDSYYAKAVSDLNVTYHIMTQTSKMMSVVYEAEDWFYSSGRNPNQYRISSEVYAITIDLVNVKRLDLTHFTPIKLPGEECPGLDLYYRILQSNDVIGMGLKVVLGPGLDESVYAEYASKEEYEDTVRTWVLAGLPSFGGFENYIYDFFVTPDSLYFISYTSTAGGDYVFVKVLDKAGPYQPPQG